MKTMVNGFYVEGTPDEIFNFIQLFDKARRDGIHIRPPLGKPPDWLYTGATIKGTIPPDYAQQQANLHMRGGFDG